MALAWCSACGASQSLPPAATSAPEAPSIGVLVMAHGGSKEWNDAVLEAVSPLRARYPVEIAFGMADATSLQEGVRKLEARSIAKIAVVRLFVSGESWFERTEQILGVRPGEIVDQPEHMMHAGHGHGHGHGHGNPHGHHGHHMASFRIETTASFALSTQGLAGAPGMGAVLADRAAALSKAPEREDVLILAHGPGDDAENERWLKDLDARAAAVRARAAFRRVEVATLREDWRDKREAAEKHVRGFVERAHAEGGQAIVIPFRVHGFGPYADVLKGLDYVSDGHGLIPHPEVTRWLEARVAQLVAGPFRPQVPR